MRRRGLRPTRARRLILGRLLKRNDHLTAEELRQALRRNGHVVSVATLYQNLNRLAQAGLLAGFPDAGGKVRFDANAGPHTHLVCTACGRILDIAPDDRRLATLRVELPRATRSYQGWTLNAVRFELRGLCPACRPRDRSRRTRA